MGFLDCLSFCCQTPNNCSIVCRNKPKKFVLQQREVDGFGLENTPRARELGCIQLPKVIPVIYHGSSRFQPLENLYVSLRFADLIDFRRKTLKFKCRRALCDHFRISLYSKIILTGVDKDKRIEPWWSLGEEQRLNILPQLKDLGIALVTTHNFSMFRCRPRMDDLHARKRIAILFAEFQNAQIPCALHTNARTPKDFEAWHEFVACREEVKTLSYEFTTGPSRKDRIGFHLNGLISIALEVRRDLNIIVRGSPRVIPSLKKHFKTVTYLDSEAFLKTVNRRKLSRDINSNFKLNWNKVKTSEGESLDSLMAHNIEEQMEYLKIKYYESDLMLDKGNCRGRLSSGI